MKENMKSCRYCGGEVEKGARRCPHCGTRNPTMGTKDAMIWTVGMILVLYIALYLYRSFVE